MDIRKVAATPGSRVTPGQTMAETPETHRRGGLASRGSSRSLVECKTPDPVASLSARMGGMVLMDKEEEGLVFEMADQARTRKGRWAVVGKSCSPRPLNKVVLERTMQRAWGLHKEAKFRDLGHNVFEVHFGSKGDWKHVLNNGPWQYDFCVLIIKNYEGGTRPSEMIFDKIDIWFKLEKIPHFCFECGRLVHVEGTCHPPVDSSQQWGGWLRTSFGKQNLAKNGSTGAGGGSSFSLGSSRTVDSDRSRQGHAKANDNPTKRNMQSEFAQSASSRTGVERWAEKGQRAHPHTSSGREGSGRDRDLREEIEQRRERESCGISSRRINTQAGIGVTKR
ncbi:hypothetical protein D1007_06337 [Hordeum vulgare]|nr:hypothetical protein D1007_06337 [Hordeum vulgare]